ncbi:hypothetical protein B296_00000044 [Ensete ventricosum]|uniref:Uncharacterized protein n=1 Tax=Ensete ventricosum TaxID=4639 RepID=A0A427AVA0_ENSVE|nr:hypothetical protein B296_00000044 [Ensete ventricosum]
MCEGRGSCPLRLKVECAACVSTSGCLLGLFDSWRYCGIDSPSNTKNIMQPYAVTEVLAQLGSTRVCKIANADSELEQVNLRSGERLVCWVQTSSDLLGLVPFGTAPCFPSSLVRDRAIPYSLKHSRL